MRIHDPSLVAGIVLSLCLHTLLLALLATRHEPGDSVRGELPVHSDAAVLMVRLATTNEAGRLPVQKSHAQEIPAIPPGSAPPVPPETVVGSEIYLPASQLDESPLVIDDIPIDPPALRNHTEGGRLVLVLWIGEKGTVDRVTEEFSELPEAISEEIRQNFYRTRFRPGIISGVPTKSRMRIEVNVGELPPSPNREAVIVHRSGQPLREGKDD